MQRSRTHNITTMELHNEMQAGFQKLDNDHANLAMKLTDFRLESEKERSAMKIEIITEIQKMKDIFENKYVEKEAFKPIGKMVEIHEKYKNILIGGLIVADALGIFNLIKMFK